MLNFIVDSIDENSRLYELLLKNKNSIRILCNNSKLKEVQRIDNINFNKKDYFLFAKDNLLILNDFIDMLNQIDSEVVYLNKYHSHNNNKFHYKPDFMHYKYGDISIYNNRFLYNDMSCIIFRCEHKKELIDIFNNKNKFIDKLINLEFKDFKYIPLVYIEGEDLPFFDKSSLESINSHFQYLKKRIDLDAVLNPINHFYLYSLWKLFGASKIIFSVEKYNKLKTILCDNFKFDYFLFLITTSCFNLDKEILLFIYLKKYNYFRSLYINTKLFSNKIRNLSNEIYILISAPIKLIIFIFMLPYYLFVSIKRVIEIYLKYLKGWK